jgi:hypothetical protein
LEPGEVLNWFDLCSAGLAREEQEAYRLLRALARRSLKRRHYPFHEAIE